jgi:tetratricopeptide (TPR) repeat protein
MVSAHFVVPGVALLIAYNLSAQVPASTPARADFLSETRAESIPPPRLDVPTPLSPETKGDILMARKMYREAAETYLEGPADSAVLANKTGIAYHQMLSFEMAKKYYDRALKLKPDYPEAINNLGTVYYAKKNFRRAITYYRRALRLQPKSASILSNLGTAQFARKRYKEALESYQQALAIDPEVFEHRNANGVLLQERSVQERAKFHYYLAKTYAKAGNFDRALIYMRKALEEGFKERDKFREDPEFGKMQELPEFKELIASEPRVL